MEEPGRQMCHDMGCPDMEEPGRQMCHDMGCPDMEEPGRQMCQDVGCPDMGKLSAVLFQFFFDRPIQYRHVLFFNIGVCFSSI